MRMLITLTVAAGIVAAACGPSASGLPEVRVGRKVEFKLTNNGRVEHDITAEGVGLHAHVMSAERLAFESGPFTPGEYDIFCSVVGHREAGMVGKIVVKP